MPRTQKEFKSAFNPDQEIRHLLDEAQDLERKLAAERKATGEARIQMLALVNALKAVEPSKMVYQPPTKRDGQPIICVAHLTDLHCGEVTHADEVEGFGEFNLDLFHARLRAFGERLLAFVQVQRSGYHIPALHVLGTGDYISGDIHEELKVTNACPAPVQAVQAGYAIGAFIDMLAPHFASVTSDLLTTDNHGRMTRKPQAAEGGQNNWCYIVAHIAKQYCARLSNVEIRIHAKPSALVPAGTQRYLLFHGHEIRGWAGVPFYGFERRAALEAVKRMGHEDATYTKLVFGHFHVAVNALRYTTGGSLSGTSTFDHSQGRHAPAHQTSWLVHPTHGEFGYTRWWL